MKTDTMKMAMVAIAGLVVAATAIADAKFDELKALASTPTNQVTAANAQSIYDAAVAVTNQEKIVYLVDKKLVSAEAAYAKTVELGWYGTALSIANLASNTTWHAELLGKFADKIIATPADDPMYKANFALAKLSIYDNGKHLLLSDTASTLAAADKLIAADKWAAASMVLFSGHSVDVETKRAKVVNEKYLDLIYTKLASGEAGDFWNKYAYFDILHTAYKINDFNKLNTFPAAIIAKIYADVDDNNCFALAWTMTEIQPFVDLARAAALKSPNLSDKSRIWFASIADKSYKNKSSSAEIYEMITDKNLKLKLALYLADTDKIIDAFRALDNTADAKTVDEVLVVINALDIDYRAADVLKALRNANAKYTLKLYEDRDSWEPVLSKIRAMIDCR